MTNVVETFVADVAAKAERIEREKSGKALTLSHAASESKARTVPKLGCGLEAKRLPSRGWPSCRVADRGAYSCSDVVRARPPWASVPGP